MPRSPIITCLITLCLLTMSQAATVVAKGIDEKLRKRMSTLMQPRLEYILERPATDWRADDAAFFMKQLLIKEGYAESEVTWEIPSNNLILLNVNLGVKYVIGKIHTTDKESLSQELLDNYFTQPLIQRELTKRELAPYLDDYPTEGATNVANYLKSKGYWDAEVTVAKISKQANGKVDIKLNLKRGKIHQILQPTFTGVDEKYREALKPIYAPYIGKIATSANITEFNNLVNKFYRDNGYQFANIQVTPKHQHHNPVGVILQFDIESGNIYRINKIYVEGNKITQNRRFKRYTKPLKKQIYDEAKANEVAKKLLLTGAFKIVRIIPEKISPNELNLVLQVKEAKPRFIRAYAGFATFDGLVLGSSYTNQNFLKKLQTLNIRSEISSRALLGELSFTEPYFAGEPISMTTRFYALQRRYDGYDKSLTGLETSFTWKPTNYYAIKLSGTLESVDLDGDGLTQNEIGPDNYINSRFSLEQTLDFRNNPVLPTKGFHARWLLEQGFIDGDASNSYFRTDINTSYRYAFKNNRKLLFRFRAGAVVPSESNDLPIDLRFFSGGADSVRSFGERELGSLGVSRDPLGGEAYWNASAEFIQPFNDLFSGVLFLDSGKVIRDANDFSFSNPTYAAGLGLRIDLPVGPARFEYGFNLNQQPGEASGAFHFSIGAQF